MSSIKFDSGASQLQQLRTINLMAESANGTAAGRIGLIGGRVVKFNTHLGERLFGAKRTDEMQQSSDALRETLCKLLEDVLKDTTAESEIEELKKRINAGMGKSLLDRSVVASVIKDVQGYTKEDLSHRQDVLQGFSSTEDMSFATVKKAAVDKMTFDESQLVEGNFMANKGKVAKDLCVDLKGLEHQGYRALAKTFDNGLVRRSDIPTESVGDTRFACKQNSFSYMTGATSEMVKGILEQKPRAKVMVQIFSDETDFLCGIDAAWSTQEEAMAYAADHDAFKKVIADGKAKLYHNEEQHQWRWKYVDDVAGRLSAVDSYTIDSKIVWGGDLRRFPDNKEYAAKFQFTAFPSMDMGVNRDIRGNVAYFCKCRGIPTEPWTEQHDRIKEFMTELVSVGKDKISSAYSWTRADILKIAMFSGENAIFDPQGSDPKAEVEKLIKHVLGEGGNLKPDAEALLNQAHANYKATMVEVVSGWVSAARQSGATHYIGGPIGCGAFLNKPQDVAEIYAEAFVKHGGDLKFVYAQFDAQKAGEKQKRELFEGAFATAFKRFGAPTKELRENAGTQDRFDRMVKHNITKPASLLAAVHLAADFKVDHVKCQEFDTWEDNFVAFVHEKLAPALMDEIRLLDRIHQNDPDGLDMPQTLKALALILLEDQKSSFVQGIVSAKPKDVSSILEKFKQQKLEVETKKEDVWNFPEALSREDAKAEKLRAQLPFLFLEALESAMK